MILPFSIGCVSQSSVAVAEDRSSASARRYSSSPFSHHHLSEQAFRDVNRDAPTHKGGGGGSTGFLPLPPRPNLTAGFQRVIKGFRGFTSQLFAYKDHRDDDDDDEEERELEIGFPTDVQHVGHIGWDGTNSTALSNMMSWDGYRKHPHPLLPQPQHQPPPVPLPPELITVPSISLRQFQMAMAAQQAHDDVDGNYPIGGYPGHRGHQHLRTAAA